MDNFEKELKKVLEKNGVFDATKSETLRKEIIQMWCDKNLLRAKLVFWIFFLICLGMIIAGYRGLRSAESTKGMILWAIFLMIGFNSTVLMKLWYWVVDAKLNIQKEVKQLQLQIAELASKNPPAEN
jgi:predicted membrane protein